MMPSAWVAEVVFRDLEEVVARKGLDDMGERLAVMAARIEAGALDDARFLAPEQRYLGGQLVIGRRGEEADEAPLADEAARGVEALDADIVLHGGAVDAAAAVRLGDDDRLGIGEEAGDLGREFGGGIGLADDPRRRIAQHAKTGFVERAVLAGRLVIAVVARAEQREVVVGEPFEEGDRLGQLGGLDRRRIAPQLLDRLGELLQHDAPVADRRRDIGEDPARRLLQRHQAGRIALAGDRHDDDALARLSVAAIVDDGMEGGFDGERRGADLAQDRIVQERLVVVDRNEDRAVIGEAVDRRIGGEDPDQRIARRARGREVAGENRQAREGLWRETDDIFGSRGRQEGAGEGGGGRA